MDASCPCALYGQLILVFFSFDLTHDRHCGVSWESGLGEREEHQAVTLGRQWTGLAWLRLLALLQNHDL